MASTGTVILTGANGSSGIAASEHLLKTYPQYHAIFTVRNAGEDDPNTQALRAVISKYPSAQATIHQVNLAKLSDVRAFTDSVTLDVQSGSLPQIKSIICNAYYWNLVLNPELTEDGYEKAIQVSHISHVALVLRLLASFGPDGRIEFLSSVAHYRRKTPIMSPYIPEIPEDAQMDNVIRPAADPDKQGRGYYRYSSAKLFNTVCAYALDRRLQTDPKLKNITVVAMNPGNMWDARSFGSNLPPTIQYLQKFIIKPFTPMIRRFGDPTFRRTSEGGVDIIELAVNPKFDGQRGYFTFLEKDDPDPAVMDEATQNRAWAKSVEWAEVTTEQTALESIS